MFDVGRSSFKALMGVKGIRGRDVNGYVKDGHIQYSKQERPQPG
jgi:hypothetical protein